MNKILRVLDPISRGFSSAGGLDRAPFGRRMSIAEKADSIQLEANTNAVMEEGRSRARGRPIGLRGLRRSAGRCRQGRFNWRLQPEGNDPELACSLEIIRKSIVLYDPRPQISQSAAFPGLVRDLPGQISSAADCGLTIPQG